MWLNDFSGLAFKSQICFEVSVSTNFVRLIFGAFATQCEPTKGRSGGGGSAASSMIKSAIWRGRRRRLG